MSDLRADGGWLFLLATVSICGFSSHIMAAAVALKAVSAAINVMASVSKMAGSW